MFVGVSCCTCDSIVILSSWTFHFSCQLQSEWFSHIFPSNVHRHGISDFSFNHRPPIHELQPWFVVIFYETQSHLKDSVLVHWLELKLLSALFDSLQLAKSIYSPFTTLLELVTRKKSLSSQLNEWIFLPSSLIALIGCLKVHKRHELSFVAFFSITEETFLW